MDSSAQVLVPSHPRARFRSCLLKVHGLGPVPGVSALSQNPRAPARALPQVFTVASTPFSRKSSRKGMQSRKRPSVTCSWAASRTRRQVSDTPCRSVPPRPAFLPLLLPPPSPVHLCQTQMMIMYAFEPLRLPCAGCFYVCSILAFAKHTAPHSFTDGGGEALGGGMAGLQVRAQPACALSLAEWPSGQLVPIG